jgi:hypothetical protein
MNEKSNVVRGVLNPDGTLELDERPSLPAGRVEVTIRPLPVDVKGEGWWEILQRIRAHREASGYRFRTKEEIDAEIEDLRSWNDEEIDELHRQIEAERRRIGPA